MHPYFKVDGKLYFVNVDLKRGIKLFEKITTLKQFRIAI